MRIGDDEVRMSTDNTKVADNITDGGFQEFSPLTKGKIVTFRRYGSDPGRPNEISSNMRLNEIRLYETVNLLKYSNVKITSDTSEAIPVGNFSADKP